MSEKTKGKRLPLARALQILKIMKGCTVNGLPLAQIALAIDNTQINTLRTIETLVEEGFMQKLDSGNYALSTQFLQIAIEYHREMQKARSYLDGLEQRVQAGSW